MHALTIFIVGLEAPARIFVQEEQRAAPAGGDADMAERPSIGTLQASARRREEEFAMRKRARVTDAGPSSPAGEV